jgi:hypothetical protein
VRKRWTGHILGGIAGLAVAAATMYLSHTKLKPPQIDLDWAALILSGLTTGIFAFFIVWGHFQKDPQPGQPQ